jgi:uncharacterized membrane protein YgdD (TMEM256/DUF423 family)
MKLTLWFRIGFISMGLGVILGAFGAHTLKNVLEPARLQAWQTAVMYHFIHSLGLLLIAHIHAHQPKMLWTLRLLLAGILCFSGSLYLLACKDLIGADLSWLGPITPLGGVLWIIAWALAAIQIKHTPTQ